MIEAFRENGLHVLDHDSEIHESRLEAVLSSIFYALNKRIPSTTDIDVERCIALVKHWLLYAYDRWVIKTISCSYGNIYNERHRLVLAVIMIIVVVLSKVMTIVMMVIVMLVVVIMM